MPKLVFDISIYMQQTFSDPLLFSRGRLSNDDHSVAYHLFVCVLIYLCSSMFGLNLFIFMESSIQSDNQSSIIYHCTFIVMGHRLEFQNYMVFLSQRFLFKQTYSAT